MVNDSTTPDALVASVLDENWEAAKDALAALRRASPAVKAAVSAELLRLFGGRKKPPFYALVALAIGGSKAGKALVYARAENRRTPEALSALGDIHERRALQMMLAAALGRPGDRTDYALEGLRTRGDPAAVAPLVAKLEELKRPKSERACDYFMAAFRTLIQLDPHDPGVARFVARLVDDPPGEEPWQREFAFGEVVQKTADAGCRSPAVEAALRAVIAGDHDARKPLAAAALGRASGDYAAWLPQVVEAINAKSADVRSGADTALEILDAAALPRFAACIAEEPRAKRKQRLAGALRALEDRLGVAGRHAASAATNDTVAALAQERGLELPELHKRLLADGRMTVPADFSAKYQHYLLTQPPLLSGAVGEVEWFSAEEMLKSTLPGHWNTDIPLVQIAGNGAGDAYCYRLDWREGDDIPIVLAACDHNRAKCLAPHLEGFLFRELLLGMTYIDLDSEFSLEEHLTILRLDVQALRGYVRDPWLDMLDHYLQQQPTFGAEESQEAALLTDDQAMAILQEELASAHLGEVFEHMG